MGLISFQQDHTSFSMPDCAEKVTNTASDERRQKVDKYRFDKDNPADLLADLNGVPVV